MTSQILRRLSVAGLTLTLAVPGAALAHGGRHHDDGYGHRGHRGHHARNLCHKLERGRAPHGLTAEQTQALTQACKDRDAAITAAVTTFRTATKADRDTYRAAVESAAADVRAARQAKRDACSADRASQSCTDARAAYRTALKAAWQKVRDAGRAYATAVAPEAKTRNDAIRAARKAFRDRVAQILGQA
jgi:hypothetical protein